MENLVGLQNVDFSGGLGGMLGGLQNQQAEQMNEAGLAELMAKMQQEQAHAEYYRQMAGADQSQRYADKIAKAQEIKDNQGAEQAYMSLRGIQGIGDPSKETDPAKRQRISDEQAFAFSNIWDKIPEKYKPLFASIGGETTEGGGMGFDFTPERLNAAVDAIAATSPTLSKTLQTEMKNTSQESINAAKLKTREDIAKLFSTNKIDVANIRAEAMKVAKHNPANVAIHKAAQLTAINNVTTNALMKANELGDEDERAKLIQDILTEAEKKKAEVNSIYDGLKDPSTPAATAPKLPPGVTIVK